MLDREEQIFRRGAIDEYFGANIQFHDRMVEMTGNVTLLRLYRRLMEHTYLLRRSSLRTLSEQKISSAEHHEIVAALTSRNLETVTSSMRKHVMMGYDRMWAVRWGSDAARPASPAARKRGPRAPGAEAAPRIAPPKASGGELEKAR
jgi:DNA-binding GntR family transcriptional regulator